MTVMTFTLRHYQQDAIDAALRHFRKCYDPAVIVLPTGAGKSLVIAGLARLARGRVLVLAHVKELVAQNHSKYIAWGLEADIFAAGLARKESGGKVVFGSVQSVARHLHRFDSAFSLLIVDECHRMNCSEDDQYQQIVTHLRLLNPKLRLLGLTATPWRLEQGWIYQYHYHGIIRGDDHAPFRDCIYELPLRYMIKSGYLVPPVRWDMPVLQYDFSNLIPQSDGLFNQGLLNQELRKQQRITPRIVQQIVKLSAARCAVMIFAATSQHAEEVLSYLPDNSAFISAKTPAKARDRIINAFKQQQIRYLVNVAVLTTGFDAPHVDTIAILRPTESVSLYQQIVGRGLRLSAGKQDCLILDYAGNPHDIFTPEPGSPRQNSATTPVQVFCPSCGFANIFWGKISEDGTLIEHFGRRCQALLEQDSTDRRQCDFRFRFRLCPHCGGENDIAARCCHHCNAILADADDMLKAALQLKDALILRCGGMDLSHGADARGEWLSAIYYDEDGTSVSERFRLQTPHQRYTFRQLFLMPHQRAPSISLHFDNAAGVVALLPLLRHPDFVVARKRGNHWEIREKLFDYQGRYRRASELR